mgnify:FL=1
MSVLGSPSAAAARDGSCTAFFGEGEAVFRLTIDAIRRLEERAQHGIYALNRRLLALDSTLDEVVEILRHGLIGGGCKPEEAARLLRSYGPGSGLMSPIEAYALAVRVMEAGLLMPAGEKPPGKAAAGEATPASTSPGSTEPAARSA